MLSIPSKTEHQKKKKHAANKTYFTPTKLKSVKDQKNIKNKKKHKSYFKRLHNFDCKITEHSFLILEPTIKYFETKFK